MNILLNSLHYFPHISEKKKKKKRTKKMVMNLKKILKNKSLSFNIPKTMSINLESFEKISNRKNNESFNIKRKNLNKNQQPNLIEINEIEKLKKPEQ